jgi:hypothetical protein
VHRTARIRLRLTRRQARRCYGLLRSAADVWAWLLDTNWQRHQQGKPVISNYQALCRQLTGEGPFGELSTAAVLPGLGHSPDDPASGGCRSPIVPDLAPGEDSAALSNRVDVAWRH